MVVLVMTTMRTRAGNSYFYFCHLGHNFGFILANVTIRRFGICTLND